VVVVSMVIGTEAIKWQKDPICPAVCSPGYDPVSMNFLTCNQDEWIGIHVAAPFITYLFTQDVMVTYVFAFGNEVVETVLFNIFDNYGPVFGFETVPEDHEGSVIGDAFFQTTWGVILGITFVQAFRAPKFFPTINEHGRKSRKKWFVWWKVLLLYTAYAISNLPASQVNTEVPPAAVNGYIHYGLLITLGSNAVAFLLIYGLTLSRVDNRLIWSRYTGRDSLPMEAPIYRRQKRALLFFIAWLVCASLLMINFVPQFFISVYYQTWMVAGIYIFIFGIIWFSQDPDLRELETRKYLNPEVIRRRREEREDEEKLIMLITSQY